MQAHTKTLGFWSCWALAVGTMIGSGILLVPASLAPYGLLSVAGWLISAAGAIAIILVFARLAGRTTRDGGPYVYVQEAFGDIAGFLMAWNYWIGFWVSIPIVAIAFVGYLGIFIPSLAQNIVAQGLTALGVIAAFTLVNVRGLKEMSVAQIVLTVLKIVPLLIIMGAGLVFGAPHNLPPLNPSHAPLLPALTAVTLITLWPFTGFEAAVSSAGAVRDPERTIPRALTAAVLLVTVIYLGASFAVMLLVPSAQLAHSEAPFADAARALGGWGPPFIALGALIATAGTLNGVIFASGQMPMAVAEDGRAPAWLAKLNKGGAPYLSLLLSSGLGALLLVLNYSRGLIGAYTFLLMMATALSLIYYFFCGLAELKHSWRSAKGWAMVALFACLFSAFAMIGSGWEVILWGGVMMAAGLPLYFWFKPRKVAALNPVA
ncbi:MAG TPA: amino acid permease [Vitreimonas sp.]|jgi:APA family basic amino acid/polyamine antiporter|nr:amino acid permease [Vitreimonas sp.]